MYYICLIIRKIKFVFVFYHNKHDIIMGSFVECQYEFECWRFCQCVQFSSKTHISITTCYNFFIFAADIGDTCFKCCISFFLNNCIFALHYLSWQNGIFTNFERGSQCVTMVIENDVIPRLFVISLYIFEKK